MMGYARPQPRYAALPGFQDPRWIAPSYQYPPSQPPPPQGPLRPQYQQPVAYPLQQFAPQYHYQQPVAYQQQFAPQYNYQQLSHEQLLPQAAQQLPQDQWPPYHLQQFAQAQDTLPSAQQFTRDQDGQLLQAARQDQDPQQLLQDQFHRSSQHDLSQDVDPEGDVRHGGYPKKRRLLKEAGQGTGTYELMENLGLVAEGGRQFLIQDRNAIMCVPPSVDDSLKFWNWLQSMDPPVDEALNSRQVWQVLVQPATPMKLPESFLLRVRRSQQVARDTQLMVPYELFESQRQGHGLTNIASSARISVDVEDCPELLIWNNKVNEGVSTASVTIDDLLAPSRPWVAEFRYLHFLLYESRQATVDAVVKMRSSRRKTQADLELPYHPLLLCFCRGAASGQPEANFFSEVHNREGICLMVNGVWQPSEVKAVFHTAVRGDPASGIYRNRAALAKMLKFNTKDPQRWHFGIFAERIERLWFCFFEYTGDYELKSIRVAPEFPYSDVWDRRNLLFDIRQLDKAEPSSTLRDVATASPQPGFTLLVRYVDTLCNLMRIPVTPIVLIPDEEQGDAPDLTEATLVGQGAKSLVLKTGDNVTKVSKEDLILHEESIHAVVDGLDYIRPMVKGQHGVVEGAGDGLRWLSLQGFGRHLRRSNVSDIVRYKELWRCGEEAVYGLHGKQVFHRDIKPANFLVMDGVLQLNDFDASCFVDDPPEDLRQRVGTPLFESTFLETNRQYQYRDDWCSLVLTFLSLHKAYMPGDDKQACMRRALQMQDVPESLKACIRWIYSTPAANGESRQRVLATIKNEPVEQTRFKEVKNERAQQTRVKKE